MSLQQVKQNKERRLANRHFPSRRYNTYNNTSKIPVTVCIAIIYKGNSILAVSDRMITGGYGDTTFEPPTNKIEQLTTSIAVLMAGDSSVQAQVYNKAFKVITEKVSAEPAKWIEVAEAAKIYADCFIKVRNETAERSVLSKYDLTLDLFKEKQEGMKDVFIEMVSKELGMFYRTFGGIASLIIGVDDNGPHIYVVEGETINCHDMIGFAAVGIGASHALSHIMLSSYSKISNEAEALLTIHQAKKKAEVAPGVGEATDMCVIGPLKGTFQRIQKPPYFKDVVKDLDNFYDKYVENIKQIDKETKEKIQNYLKDLTPPKKSTQKVTKDNPVEQPKKEDTQG